MNEDFQKLIDKVNKLKASGTVDLSMEEDLSIAIMNLVSLEEHFFFTSQKTSKDSYLGMLSEVREVRKKLLAKLMPENEGETWCISKHLLGASMRIMEVAVKLRYDGKEAEAKDMFSQAYKVYSLFWAIRLKLIDTKDVKAKPVKEGAWSYDDLVTKLVDCCKE